MVSRVWNTGLHLQQDGVRAVALQRRREGWQLNRWWYFPFADVKDRSGPLADNAALLNALQALRAEL
ncbi:MAG TPA: DNA utilization protein HofM, partial [Enterobacteriaceae bacterium]|nr:DNA utilization protein HofM [Enterobacteriaceae bacterium]